jgi:hypothetical protein
MLFVPIPLAYLRQMMAQTSRGFCWHLQAMSEPCPTTYISLQHIVTKFTYCLQAFESESNIGLCHILVLGRNFIFLCLQLDSIYLLSQQPDIFSIGDVRVGYRLDIFAELLWVLDGEETKNLSALRESVAEDVSLDTTEMFYFEGFHCLVRIDRQLMNRSYRSLGFGTRNYTDKHELAIWTSVLIYVFSLSCT